MLGCSGEVATDFLAEVQRFIADPAGQLVVPASAFLGRIDNRQATEIIVKVVGDPPRRSQHLIPMIVGLISGGPAAAGWGAVASYNVDIYRHNTRIRDISKLLAEMTLARPTIGLTEAERTILRTFAETYAAGSVATDDWSRFLAGLVWNDGTCALAVPPNLAHHKHLPLAEESLRTLLKATQPAHTIVLETAAKAVSGHAPPKVRAALTAGAKWMNGDDLAASAVYTCDARRHGLVIGLAENGQPVMFSGNESLISIGGPGTGKTQAQVIPNLLNYPGSAFVLDVKGELWDLTSGRRSQFGPVYRFAPTDATGATHRYNPFDLISTDPDEAALDCQSLAHQLLPEKHDLKDPYWEDRGRDYIWTFALLIALTAEPHQRTLERLAAYLSLPLAFDDLNSRTYKNSETAKAIGLLQHLASTTGITDLANNATAMETALTTESNRMESVFDTARRHVALFARAADVRRAMSGSDWHPLDLRKAPGTTVYFCLKPGELRAFAPLVRIVFQQHAAALTKAFAAKPNELPITFFLDEMPQLGNLAALNDILDVGRGAGLRLWMFAQYLGQIRDIYGARANGLINACQVRSFLQPDNDAAEFIAPALGKTRSLFKGDDRPLAEPHDLMGQAYREKIVALARGEHPAVLNKLMAHRYYGHWMRLPHPRVRVPGRTP